MGIKQTTFSKYIFIVNYHSFNMRVLELEIQLKKIQAEYAEEKSRMERAILNLYDDKISMKKSLKKMKKRAEKAEKNAQKLAMENSILKIKNNNLEVNMEEIEKII